jgi:hypothetical protein
MPALLRSNRGQLIDLATLQTAGDTKHYYVEVLREPDGEVTLAFLVATASGLQPAVTVDGSTLTLLVAQSGNEGWTGKTIELTRPKSSQAEGVIFRGRLPEAVQGLELTAVIPKLRIGGQRLHARFTMPVPGDGEQ